MYYLNYTFYAGYVFATDDHGKGLYILHPSSSYLVFPEFRLTDESSMYRCIHDYFRLERARRHIAMKYIT